MSIARPNSNFFVNLWHRLTAPSPALPTADDRRKARILANMLIIALPLGLGGVLAPFIIGGVTNLLEVSEFQFSAIALVITLVAYTLSRSRYYHWGALIAVANTWIIIFLVMGLTPYTDQYGFFYLTIPVLLSGVFLPPPVTLGVAVTNILGMYVFALLRPEVTIIDLSISLSFNIIMYPLMFLAFRQRAFLMLERQQQEQAEKLQAETLRMELDKARQLGDLRNQFMTMISHEFRTPLATILSSSQILERYRDRMDEQKQGEYFTIIREQVQRLTRMIEDVLLLSRLAAGQIELEPVNQSIVHFCRAIVGGMRLEAGRIAIRVLDNGMDRASFDPEALEAILRKLLENAHKYSPPDSVIELQLWPTQQALQIVIRDQGIGISPEDQGHLYEPFFRGGNISNIPGTGLGLSIVRHYVDLMHGQIEVTSTLGEGTTFEVSLPLAAASPQAETLLPNYSA